MSFEQLRKQHLSLLKHVNAIHNGLVKNNWTKEQTGLSECISSIYKIINQLTPSEVSQLFSFIVITLPLSSIIKLYNAEDHSYLTQHHTTLACECFSLLFSKTNFRSYLCPLLELFIRPFVEIKQQELKAKENQLLSSEYQESLLKCQYTLLKPFVEEDISQLKEEYLPLLAEKEKTFIACEIANLLQIAKESNYRSVQIYSLQTLDIFCKSLIKYDGISLLYYFLPGITEALILILSGDYKRGSKVFSLAGVILSEVLVSLFGKENEQLRKSNDLIQNEFINNKKWIENVVFRLTFAFQKIFATLSSIDQQLHWKVSF